MGVKNMLEQSARLKYFFILSSFILLLDCCLVFFYDKNILDLSDFVADPDLPVGEIIIFFGFFVLLMSIVFPTIRWLLQALSFEIISRITRLIPCKHEKQENYKSSNVVLKQALLKKDYFLYSLVLEHKKGRNAEEMNLTTGFGMTVLLVYNIILGVNSSGSLSQEAWHLWQADHGLAIRFTLIAAFSPFLMAALFHFVVALQIKEDRMYLPELPSEVTSESRGT